jgi:hypothetical protein
LTDGIIFSIPVVPAEVVLAQTNFNVARFKAETKDNSLKCNEFKDDSSKRCENQSNLLESCAYNGPIEGDLHLPARYANTKLTYLNGIIYFLHFVHTDEKLHGR